MNKLIEEEIIRTYVKKNKQERIIWEFNNPKKRKSVIWKFDRADIFLEECLHSVQYMSSDEMEKCLFRLGKIHEVYYIGEDYIGNLSLKQATKWANKGGICIIYCGKGVGYYQGEQEVGAPPRYLLLRKV